MVDSVCLVFLNSSNDEIYPQISLLGVAHFAEWLYIFSDMVLKLLIRTPDVVLGR